MQRSTLAWFRAVDPDPSNPLDDTALLIDALRVAHDIDVITARGAHDFVWKHFRRPYDLCVYELRDDRAHRFIPPYLVHYPGIVILRGRPARTSRLLYRSRLVVTPHSAVVETIEDEHPGVRARFATAAVAATDVSLPGLPTISNDSGSPDEVGSVDVVVALEWPPTGDALTTALLGMAQGRVVIAFDDEATADWPALNPQDWQPRDVLRRGTGSFRPADPIFVSIDPRDEQHSMRLALHRLRADAVLRNELGTAARAWWAAHATVDHAVRAWQSIIEEALTLEPPPLPADSVGLEDGTAKAKEILAEFGIQTDLFLT